MFSVSKGLFIKIQQLDELNRAPLAVPGTTQGGRPQLLSLILMQFPGFMYIYLWCSFEIAYDAMITEFD